MSIEVRNDTDAGRYVIEADGVEAGFTEYHLRSGSIYFFVHTEINDDFSGQGIGSGLARGAMDDVRANGGSVVPLCPFIAGWLEKHPDYDDLINHEVWDRIAGRS